MGMGGQPADSAKQSFPQAAAHVVELHAELQTGTVEEAKHAFTQILDRHQMQPRPCDGLIEPGAGWGGEPFNASSLARSSAGSD